MTNLDRWKQEICLISTLRIGVYMFGIGNWFEKQAISSRIDKRNKSEKRAEAWKKNKIESAAKQLAQENVKLWGAKVKNILANKQSNDSDITVDDMQVIMSQFLKMYKLNSDDLDVIEISDRILDLTIERKERVMKDDDIKHLFYRLAFMFFSSRV